MKIASNKKTYKANEKNPLKSFSLLIHATKDYQEFIGVYYNRMTSVEE